MSTNKDRIDWRKRGVKRERNHEPLVTKLSSSRGAENPIFSFNKDLMVFAAMVGHSLGKRRPIAGDTISILLEQYAPSPPAAQLDAYIYLIALMEDKNATILKDENLAEAIKIFEEYCNAGLYEIKLWLDENPGDHEGIDTLYKKIFEKIVQNEKDFSNQQSNETINVEF